MIDSVEALRKLTLAAMRTAGMTTVARPLLSGIGVILMLHRVTAAPAKPLDLNGHLAVHPQFLDAVLGEMKRRGYRFVSMDEATHLTRQPEKGPPFAAITLDDGYRDNLLEALPVFEKHETPFTIYIAPGLINGAVSLWWDVIEDVVTIRDRVHLATESGSLELEAGTPREKAQAFRKVVAHLSQGVAEEDQHRAVQALGQLPDADLLVRAQADLMTWDEIRSIAQHPLGTIGAHTVHHYALKRLDRNKALAEMVEAVGLIEREIGERPRHMAYPYGFAAAVGEREAELAKEAGFLSAVTTRHGLIQRRHADHLHALPRLSLNGRYQSLDNVQTMLSGVTVPLANKGRRFVTM